MNKGILTAIGYSEKLYDRLQIFCGRIHLFSAMNFFPMKIVKSGEGFYM